MRVLGVTIAAFLCLPMAASACPWAGNAYKAGSNNGHILLRPNSDCSALKISHVTTPGESDTLPLVKKGRNWIAKLGRETSISFGPNGRTIRLVLGVRTERMGFTRVEIK